MSDKRPNLYSLDDSEVQRVPGAVSRWASTGIVPVSLAFLLGLMVYLFARIGAAVGMRVEVASTQSRLLWVRLREEAGMVHAMPCRDNLYA